jgi:shikimate kinase
MIYLDVDLQTLTERIDNLGTRGLAKHPDQDLSDLLAERSALYQQYADQTIACSGLNHEQVCERVINQITVDR